MSLPDLVARRTLARHQVLEALQLAQLGIHSTSYQRALAYLHDAAETDAAYYEPHFHLGCASLAAGNMAEAGQRFHAAIRRDSSLGGSSSAAWQTYGSLGEIAEMQARPQEAVLHYHHFLMEYPQAAEAFQAATRITMLADCGGPWVESFARGVRALDLGQAADAIAHLQLALRCYPGGLVLYIFLGRSQRVGSYLEDSIKSFETALNSDHNAAILVDLACSYERIGNPYLEETIYRQALEVHPAYPWALYSLGSLLVSRRQRSDALPYLQKAVMLAPESPWAARAWKQVEDILQRGQVVFPACLHSPVEWKSWQNTDLGMVLPHPAAALLAGPSDADAQLLLDITDGVMHTFHILLRQFLVVDDDPKGPLRRYVRRMEGVVNRRLESKKPLNQDGLPGYLFECKNDRTEMVELVSVVQRGDVFFELRLECPQGVWLQGRTALFSMFNEWKVWSNPTRHARRLQLSEAVVQTLPDDVEARLRLIEVLLDMDQYDAADRHLHQVANRRPNWAPAMLAQGRLYLAQKKTDAALKVLERALALLPTSVPCLMLLGRAYTERGQHPKAWKSFERVVELAPTLQQAHVLLAQAAEEARQPQAAIDEYTSLLETWQDPWSIHMLLGTLYRRQKRPQDALVSARAAVSLDPQGVNGHLLLGLSCLDVQYFDQAEKEFNKALNLDMQCQAARQALADLQIRRKSARRY